jgi:hypothetical protein
MISSADTTQSGRQDVARVQMVLSRIGHHKKPSSLVQCLISISASGRKYIDFNRAYNRFCSGLSHAYSRRSFYRCDLVISSFNRNEKSQFISSIEAKYLIINKI